jgi:hypothetical protein
MNKVSIYGGLGNQMFQYALYVALNEKGLKSDIFITDFFFNHHHNGFNLYKAFKIKLTAETRFYNFFLCYGGFIYKNKISNYLLKNIVSLYKKKKYQFYFERNEFIFDKNVFNQNAKFFVGTWQTEKYFQDIKEVLKNSFIFCPPSDVINKENIDKINVTNSVSIHIRRGDFVADKWVNTHTVIKDKTYYTNSVNYINNNVENPHYFIFSDDIQWVKDNLSFSDCTFIENNIGENLFNEFV